MAKLIVRRSGETEQERSLSQEPLAVGREGTNDVVLLDPSVSRHHARVEPAGRGGYRVVDLDSGNGVVHKGERVKTLSVYSGCSLELGVFTLEFELDSESSETAKLALICGGEREVFSLGDGETVVGRSSEASIRLPDPLVSGKHFKIVKRGSVFAVVDLGSENGTYVDGVRVKEKALEHGAQITVGGLTLYFSADGTVPELVEIEIVQPTLSAIPPAAEKPVSIPRAELRARPAAARETLLKKSSVPRLALIGSGVFVVLLVLILAIAIRSPEDGAQREFQEVFQSNLTADQRERIEDYASLATDYGERENFELALEQYRKILVLDPAHQESLAQSSRLEEQLEQQTQDRESREQEDRERLGQVAELTERADALISEAKFDEARSILEAAIALSSESEDLSANLVDFHIARGDYHRTRNPNQAAASYRKAIELDPEHDAAKRKLSRIGASRRARRQAQQRIEQLMEAGLAQLRREVYREAFQSFSEIVKLEPGNTRALEFREQASKLREQQVRPIYEDGVRLYNAGELQAAMALFNRALELYPTHAETRSFLSKVMEKVRSEAIDRYKRAYIYEGLGRSREALELYREALALLPDPTEEYHQKASDRIAELNRKRQ
jgi:pSer/pThr/pTyr-binding forkhead associated (FHA) protein